MERINKVVREWEHKGFYYSGGGPACIKGWMCNFLSALPWKRNMNITASNYHLPLLLLFAACDLPRISLALRC